MTNALVPSTARYAIEYMVTLHNFALAGFHDQANMHSTLHFTASLS